MKKVIAILISCSFALAVNAIAQQDEQQQKQKKQKAPPERSQPANAARPAPQPRQTAPRQHAETKTPGHEQGQRESSSKSHMTKAPQKERANASADKEQTEQREKEHNATNETETANKPPEPATANEREQSAAAPAPKPNKPGNRLNAQGNKLNAKANKPDQQTIQRIKTQHASFRAQARPDKVPAATFSQNYRIHGAEHWQGPQYQVFRSYHPEWHDRGWYHSHFNRIELIGGGYYYWNNGYWFPAWGYDTSAQYYAYDAPIYVGSQAEPPDRVIADVQAALQEMGYYQGEVDGLLGPLTREALTAYQSDHGLYTTAVIDEPTLSSLGMS
jgi:hypothetical protein